MSQADLVIRNATIVDGTGDPSFTGDVAIESGRITSVGNFAGAARERARPVPPRRSSA